MMDMGWKRFFLNLVSFVPNFVFVFVLNFGVQCSYDDGEKTDTFFFILAFYTQNHKSNCF